MHHITYQYGVLAVTRKEGGHDNLAMFFLKLVVSQFVQLHTHRQETLVFRLSIFVVDLVFSFKILENIMTTMGKCLLLLLLLLLLLPLALQPPVGFGLSNNVLPFFPICHQLSPSSHSRHLKISLYFLFRSFLGSSPSSRSFKFLSEDLFGHPILLHSL